MALRDIAIIGGGPAGLTAAATLARQLRTAVVFDSGVYRNAKASHMHMVPGWENRDPKEFRESAKNGITHKYKTIEFAEVGVAKIEKKTDSLFLVKDANDEEREFRKVILAVGSANIFPPIDGYEELWADRIFHCLFCKGYEHRTDSSAGVLAVDSVSNRDMAIHFALDAAQLAKEVTIYTNGNEELTAQVQSSITNEKFKIESRPIKKLSKASSGLVQVEFTDGDSREETFLAHNPNTRVQGPFVSQLGIKLTETGDIDAPAPFPETSVRGVFAAGDCITPYKVIPGAISSGCNAAVAASTQLHANV